MKVAVWDTYVKQTNGVVKHFDIVVPDTIKDAATIYGYGSNHLASLAITDANISLEECQFCHIESPTTEMMDSIAKTGYYIIEMDDIAASLPTNPTHTQLIMHLRGHYPKYRFSDLTSIPTPDLHVLINEQQAL